MSSTNRSVKMVHRSVKMARVGAAQILEDLDSITRFPKKKPNMSDEDKEELLTHEITLQKHSNVEEKLSLNSIKKEFKITNDKENRRIPRMIPSASLIESHSKLALNTTIQDVETKLSKVYNEMISGKLETLHSQETKDTLRHSCQ